MRTLKVDQREDLQVLLGQRGGELRLEKSGDGGIRELPILVQACEDLCVLEIQR